MMLKETERKVGQDRTTQEEVATFHIHLREQWSATGTVLTGEWDGLQPVCAQRTGRK